MRTLTTNPDVFTITAMLALCIPQHFTFVSWVHWSFRCFVLRSILILLQHRFYVFELLAVLKGNDQNKRRILLFRMNLLASFWRNLSKLNDLQTWHLCNVQNRIFRWLFIDTDPHPQQAFIFFQDRYILATMLTLALICFWHGIQTVLHIPEENDFIACVVFVSGYAVYNLQFVVRILALVRTEHVQ